MPIAATQKWIEQFVLRHNLCPFAHHPFHNDQIRYRLSTVTTLEEVVIEFLQELDYLDQKKANTTLIIYPKTFQEFQKFLALIELLEDVLEEEDRLQDYQLASFHPLYQFAEIESHDPANRTNQSPYPMVHLLRCADVKHAIDSHQDTMSIPERNVQLMRTIFR